MDAREFVKENGAKAADLSFFLRVEACRADAVFSVVRQCAGAAEERESIVAVSEYCYAKTGRY